MTRFAEDPMPRQQYVLIRNTLDDLIPQDHPVRLMDEILDWIDWSDWIQHYTLVEGRPPIHPKTLAAIILYALTLGIRSSRRLEYACGHSVDFMWLGRGHRPDHSKICQFRT